MWYELTLKKCELNVEQQLPNTSFFIRQWETFETRKLARCLMTSKDSKKSFVSRQIISDCSVEVNSLRLLHHAPLSLTMS